jgi:polar amino acid transport system ATP-binding protein
MENKSRSEQVAQRILRMIADGTLQEGDKLPSEPEFAKQLGISRGILREGLAQLKAQGVIRRKPKDGTYIMPLAGNKDELAESTRRAIEASSFRNIMEMRSAIEQKAAALAVERATDEELRNSRLHFGLVFQNFNLFPQYNALENITLAPKLLKQGTPEEIQRKALTLLDQVGLSQKAGNYPHQLSGGQQQRLAIARALALNPEILCFDEPTSALDPELTGEVLRVIRSLKDQNNTMIVVTHEMGFAKSVADVVIYMAEGVIEEIGTPEQIFENPTSPKTRAFIQGTLETF